MSAKPKKLPLHQLLVDRGLCADEKSARAWILAGKVIVNEERIDKAGFRVSVESAIRLKGQGKYVGKGGHKLEGALTDLRIDVTGKTVLDAGAAAGGFTDCLLRHGAAKVYAVDVGYGSLSGKLQNDPRVVSLERTNISDLKPEHFDPQPTLATVDLSYLSLKKAIPIVAGLLTGECGMACLVKPLFEVSDAAARRTGRIAASTSYSEMLRDLVGFVDSAGLKTLGLMHSPVPGGKGTLEFFIHVAGKHAGIAEAPDIDRIVQDGLARIKTMNSGKDA